MKYATVEDKDEVYEYVWDENHDGPCTVLKDSAVDTWAGGTLEIDECPKQATHVIGTWDDDVSYVCEEHAKAWHKFDSEAMLVEALNCRPVSEDEVQAAIASIMKAGAQG